MKDGIFSFFHDPRRHFPRIGADAPEPLNEMSDQERVDQDNLLKRIGDIATEIAKIGGEVALAAAAARRIQADMKSGRAPKKRDILVLAAAIEKLGTQVAGKASMILDAINAHRNRRPDNVFGRDYDPEGSDV